MWAGIQLDVWFKVGGVLFLNFWTWRKTQVNGVKSAVCRYETLCVPLLGFAGKREGEGGGLGAGHTWSPGLNPIKKPVVWTEEGVILRISMILKSSAWRNPSECVL